MRDRLQLPINNVVRFQVKYRVESARLKGWDYTRAGWYYITICTRSRLCHFGTIKLGQMIPSAVGEIVAQEWQRTPEVRSNTQLDTWTLMPNHLHGIIVIQETLPRAQPDSDAVESAASVASVGWSKQKPSSLGTIVGQIKSVCTKRIRAAGIQQFDWQTRFYEHIIRDDRALANIRQYITNNVAQWELDELNPDQS